MGRKIQVMAYTDGQLDKSLSMCVRDYLDQVN